VQALRLTQISLPPIVAGTTKRVAQNFVPVSVVVRKMEIEKLEIRKLERKHLQ
jgi:hypothetical protein